MACVEGTTPTAKWSRARSRARPRSWVSEPFPRPRGLNVPSAWQGNVGRTPPWDSVWVLTALGMIWEAGVRGDLSQDSSSQALWGWGTRRVGARVTASRQSMPGYRCVWWVSDVYLRGQRNPSPAL